MATVEELVVSCVYRSNGIENRLKNLESIVVDVLRENEKLKDKLDKVSEAEKGVAEEAKKTGDEVEKSSNKASNALANTEKQAASMFKTFIKGFLSIGAIYGFGKAVVSNALESAAALGSLSRASGETRQDIEALQRSFESLGASRDKAGEFIKSWGDARSEAALGRRAKIEQSFNRMGVQTRDKNGGLRRASDVLFESGQKAVADSGGDKNLAMKRMQNNGVDEETARAAVNGTKELLEAKKALNHTTDEEYEKAEKVAKQYAEAKQNAETLAMRLGMHLMPAIEKLVDLFSGLFDALDDSEDTFQGFEIAAGGIAAVLIAIGGPFTAAIGVATAFLLVLQNIEGWTGSGGNIVANFFRSWSPIFQMIQGAINAAIATAEIFINALDRIGVAIDNITGGTATHTEIKLPRLGSGESSSGGGSSASSPSPRGAIRGSWGRGGGGVGSGGRGRRGGGGGRGGSGGGREEPIYHSRYQGTADPKRLGMTPAVAKIDEDPAKERAKNAKGGRSPVQAGARQVAQGGNVFNITNSITVNAQGNQNASQIASKTADAVNSVSRRQAGAMV